ncbi:Uncharacterized protein FWK35_00016581 [Aphis craccivora]|uniref:Uncharacterized protein n=1 Tax=Aphis craccivora TaxID=307492 RepID=A0A6G0YE25_APHCR|nr:Uncharacterized protein FWK35_00016581 [Aphis craccivora]
MSLEYLRELVAPAMPSLATGSTAVFHTEVQLVNLVFLIGIFLVLVVYVIFYALIYQQSDSVRRSDREIADSETKGKTASDPCRGHYRWFQPFCISKNSNDPVTEWMGDWISDCSSASDVSSDEEIKSLYTRVQDSSFRETSVAELQTDIQSTRSPDRRNR